MSERHFLIKDLDEVVSHPGAAPTDAEARLSGLDQGTVINIIRKYLGVNVKGKKELPLQWSGDQVRVYQGSL